MMYKPSYKTMYTTRRPYYGAVIKKITEIFGDVNNPMFAEAMIPLHQVKRAYWTEGGHIYLVNFIFGYGGKNLFCYCDDNPCNPSLIEASLVRMMDIERVSCMKRY